MMWAIWTIASAKTISYLIHESGINEQEMEYKRHRRGVLGKQKFQVQRIKKPGWIMGWDLLGT